MNLLDYELIPSVAVSVDDDEHLGRIKVTIPGSEIPGQNIRMEGAPWCLPFTMSGGYQGFTKLVENSKVWVIRNRKNPYEMWYIPMVDLNDNTADIAETYDSTDILISRNCGGNNVYIYYTDGNGIMISIGKAQVNVKSDGEIFIQDADGGKAIIKGGNVYLNTSSSNESPVRGKVLIDALSAYADTMTKAFAPLIKGDKGGAIAQDAATNLKRAIQKSKLCPDNVFIP